jgi:hypothetical protein
MFSAAGLKRTCPTFLYYVKLRSGGFEACCRTSSVPGAAAPGQRLQIHHRDVG